MKARPLSLHASGEISTTMLGWCRWLDHRPRDDRESPEAGTSTSIRTRCWTRSRRARVRGTSSWPPVAIRRSSTPSPSAWPPSPRRSSRACHRLPGRPSRPPTRSRAGRTRDGRADPSRSGDGLFSSRGRFAGTKRIRSAVRSSPIEACQLPRYGRCLQPDHPPRSSPLALAPPPLEPRATPAASCQAEREAMTRGPRPGRRDGVEPLAERVGLVV